MLRDHLVGLLRREGDRASEETVEEDADRVDVGASVLLADLGLLWGRELRDLEELWPAEDVDPRGRREAGVEQLDVVELIARVDHEDVGGADAAVDEALAVDDPEGADDLEDEPLHPRPCEALGAAAKLAQVAADEVFADQVDAAVGGLPVAQQAREVGVAEERVDPCFAENGRGKVTARGEARIDDRRDDLLAQRGLLGEIDLACITGPEVLDERVLVRDYGADLRGTSNNGRWIVHS